jgi:hypothetical protein
MAKNKASDPNGLPTEFIQTYWPTLKPHTILLFDSFFKCELDLIIMIPKEAPKTVSDYRPISIINLFQNS